MAPLIDETAALSTRRPSSPLQAATERGPFNPLQITIGGALPDTAPVAIFRVDNPLAEAAALL
ncbi:MAG: hypothetical protein IPL38_20300 [Rhodobacter sp.]|nr:hypothetical protein [Rhodobacter sp.]